MIYVLWYYLLTRAAALVFLLVHSRVRAAFITSMEMDPEGMAWVTMWQFIPIVGEFLLLTTLAIAISDWTKAYFEKQMSNHGTDDSK